MPLACFVVQILRRPQVALTYAAVDSSDGDRAVQTGKKLGLTPKVVKAHVRVVRDKLQIPVKLRGISSQTFARFLKT